MLSLNMAPLPLLVSVALASFLPLLQPFPIELVHSESIRSPYFRPIVNLLIGNPPTNLSLLLDTGSTLTWTQCENCSWCFDQDPPLYSPARSFTYHPGKCPSRRPCRYMKEYKGPNGRRLTTRGTWATDDFAFPRTGSTITFSGKTFGCSDDSDPDFFGKAKRKVGGVLGMGVGQMSLVSQLGSVIHHRFSYCLKPSGKGYLRFGDDIRETPKRKITRLYTSHGHYYLHLQGISINNRRLNLPPATFRSRTVINSGFPLTSLTTAAYVPVINRLKAYFENKYQLRQANGSRFHLHLCYRYPANGKFLAYPNMTLHFKGGADLRLRGRQLFRFRPKMFCLNMKETRFNTVLGAAQQANVQFVHDIKAKELRFEPKECRLH